MAPRIAVYGSSLVSERDPGYTLAYDLGKALARRGATVVTGAYGGVMEAASRGAAEAGGHVVGVTVELEAYRGPGNRWVAERVHAADLLERLRHLVIEPDARIVLEPSLGTLTELYLAWTLANYGAIKPGSLILLGPQWPDYLEAHRGVIADALFALLQCVDTVDEAVRLALSAAQRGMA
ncbi:MAG TPA: LOG family protein, partial [Candidatus Eisenbacteria bacterium]|nr:LOG family protein [Candidatus Eisenbacteria bacterium]